MRRKKTKIGVCSFQGRVCPRFDLTPEILIFDMSRSGDKHTEKIEVQRNSPERVIKLLAQKDVSVVVSGGIQGEYQRMLQSKKIDVIWGVTGRVQDVVRAYGEGVLDPGVRIASNKSQRVTSGVSNKPKQSDT
jgi:predicted Fe-Mo cluster-binding NifX family protein